MNITTMVAIMAALAAVMVVATTSQSVMADRNNHPHEGNTGQCIKINRELNLGGSKEDCRDTFSGHNPPPPLP